MLAASASVAALVMLVSAIGMGAYAWTSGQVHTIPEPPGGSDPSAGKSK